MCYKNKKISYNIMEIKINVPTSLSEIVLKDYQKFIGIQAESNDEEFVAQKMIELFCGIKYSEIANIKLTSLNELVAHFSELFSKKSEFKNRFFIENVEFGFIPELEEITYGEYVDLEENLQSWDNFHKAMAILYRPIKSKFKDKYDIVKYKPNKDMEELMRFAPLDICLGASLFFWSLGSELLTATLNYLENNLTKEMSTNLAIKLNLPNDGDGIRVYMDSLRATLQSTIRLQDTNLLNVSRISHSKSKKTKLKIEKSKE